MSYYYSTPAWPSGSACPGCNTQLNLPGSNFSDPYTRAHMAIACLSFVATFALLIWCFIKRGAALGATLTTLVLFALSIIIIAIPERHVKIMWSWFVIYVFQEAFDYLALGATLLAIGHLVRAKTAVIGALLAAIGIASIGVLIRITVYEVNELYLNGSIGAQQANLTDRLYQVQSILDMVFWAVQIVATLYVMVLCVRERAMFAFGACAALIVEMVFFIAEDALYYIEMSDFFVELSRASLRFLQVAPDIEDVMQVAALVLLLLAAQRAVTWRKDVEEGYGQPQYVQSQYATAQHDQGAAQVY
ncbi:hypothetical protein AMS68_006878 [Peltaster fructicola]|uniref:Uncharacterized protein n=1 Tax=Peltaster fructicola TaxID=286661 RepID=A0A6H0Y376_9PEZI|nr:hypothetical protein AMS68_006878 [Peltaster fructicola]